MKISLLKVTIMTLIREMIIVLSSNIPNQHEVLSQVIKGQRSKPIRNPMMTLFKKMTSLISWLNFLGLITSIIEKQSLLLPLNVCKYFIEINLIQESCSLIETLLKPHTLSLDDKFHSNILTFSLKYRNHNIVLEKKIIASM